MSEEEIVTTKGGQPSVTGKKLLMWVAAAFLVVLLAVILFVVFWARSPKDRLEEAGVSASALELQELYRFANDCNEVIRRADDLIQNNNGSNDVDILLIKGACEFELKDYEAAKQTLNRVLALDPQNQPATITLRQIEEALSNNVVYVDPKKDALNLDYVESKLGFALDQEEYPFLRATALTPPDSSLERFTASFKTENSFEQTVEDIERALRAAGVEFEKNLSSSMAQFSVKLTESAGAFRGYSVTIINQEPIDISVFYEN